MPFFWLVLFQCARASLLIVRTPRSPLPVAGLYGDRSPYHGRVGEHSHGQRCAAEPSGQVTAKGAKSGWLPQAGVAARLVLPAARSVDVVCIHSSCCCARRACYLVCWSMGRSVAVANIYVNSETEACRVNCAWHRGTTDRRVCYEEGDWVMPNATRRYIHCLGSNCLSTASETHVPPKIGTIHCVFPHTPPATRDPNPDRCAAARAFSSSFFCLALFFHEPKASMTTGGCCGYS